jgi:hypothetical protein
MYNASKNILSLLRATYMYDFNNRKFFAPFFALGAKIYFFFVADEIALDVASILKLFVESSRNWIEIICLTIWSQVNDWRVSDIGRLGPGGR